MEDYAFTIKYVSKDHTHKYLPSDYDTIFIKWMNLGCVVETKYAEEDSKGRCHIHGIVNIPKGFLRKKLCQTGLHVKLDKIYERSGWLSYIRKAQAQKPLFKTTVVYRDTNDDSEQDTDSSIEVPQSEDVMHRITTKLF